MIQKMKVWNLRAKRDHGGQMHVPISPQVQCDLLKPHDTLVMSEHDREKLKGANEYGVKYMFVNLAKKPSLT